MNIKIYTTIEDDFIADWYALWAQSAFANYSNAPAWFLSVIENIGFTDYKIIALYNAGKLIGVAPLVSEKRFGLAVYSLVPADYICGLPFLIDTNSRKALSKLTKVLADLGTISYENVPKTLIEEMQPLITLKAIDTNINYFLPIEKDEQGRGMVRKKKRLLRRSEEIENELSLKEYSGYNATALETAFAIDVKSNKQTYGYNAFSDEGTKALYRSLAKHFDTHFFTYILYHKSKPIAYQLGFLCGSTFYASQISFLKEYDIYSVGRSLLIRLIEHLGTNNVATIDFGSGEDHVKRSLTKESRVLCSVVIAKKSFVGTYLLNVNKTKNKMYESLHTNKSVYALYRTLKNTRKK